MKVNYYFLVFSLLLLSACAQYKGGFTSVPYVGKIEPDLGSPSTLFELGQLETIRLPESKLHMSIGLNNQIKTYDFTLFFLVPVQMNQTESLTHIEQDHLQLKLHISPQQDGFRFNPHLITIRLDGQEVTMSAAWIEDNDKRFNHLYKAYHLALAKRAAAIRSGISPEDAPKANKPKPEEWREPVDTTMVLNKSDKSYWFIVDFDAPVPATDRGIILDLSKALQHPDLEPVPLIRFKKISWSEGRS